MPTLVKKAQLGLGLPGFVNLTTGLAEVTNIRVADNKPILADLERVLDREVRAENDANCLHSRKPVMKKYPISICVRAYFRDGLWWWFCN